jgi:hypothetical protein
VPHSRSSIHYTNRVFDLCLITYSSPLCSGLSSICSPWNRQFYPSQVLGTFFFFFRRPTGSGFCAKPGSSLHCGYPPDESNPRDNSTKAREAWIRSQSSADQFELPLLASSLNGGRKKKGLLTPLASNSDKPQSTNRRLIQI